MTRIVPVIVLVVLAASRVASADMGSLPNGVTVQFDKLYIHENGSKTAELPKTNPDSLWKYFNLAHCECAKAMPGFVEANFEYLLTPGGSTQVTSDQTLQIWVGPSCDDTTSRNTMCHQVNQPSSMTIRDIVAQKNVRAVVSVYDLMTPAPSGGACQQVASTSTVWGYIPAEQNNGALYSISKPITTDAKPPPAPTNFRGAGIDSGVEISWTPASDTSDVFAYQVLCADATNDARVKNADPSSRRYITAKMLCNAESSVKLNTSTLSVTSASMPDAGANVSPTPTTGLADLDPTFLCGEAASPTASSVTVSGLKNGTPYKFILVVVDKYQNPWFTSFTSTITPVPSTDFWEDLHGNGSAAQGGLCLLAETYGDDSGLTGALRAFRDDTLGGSRAGRWLIRAYYATLGKLGGYVHGSLALRVAAAIVLAPVVAVALIWHWLTLPALVGLLVLAWFGWRRRAAVQGRLRRIRAARAVAAGALAVVALAASPARAGGYEPYWENDPAATDETRQGIGDDSSDVTWHVGIRVGPYTPDIDDQLGKSPGPFQQMFGKSLVLPVLDVDRVLWRGYGQLGVGFSAGYTQKLAHTFAQMTDTSSATPKRVADTNRFHLLPLALTATYRLTRLDDDYGIPLVPYVRAGLSYYVWWIDLPKQDGSPLAKVCKDGGMEPDCSQNKALGGSLGVQGSIGLAIRAERIDATAAMSMRQSGIQHAGIYAELSLAKVNGFGSDKKLSVGDRTWFAGVDFEF